MSAAQRPDCQREVVQTVQDMLADGSASAGGAGGGDDDGGGQSNISFTYYLTRCLLVLFRVVWLLSYTVTLFCLPSVLLVLLLHVSRDCISVHFV